MLPDFSSERDRVHVLRIKGRSPLSYKLLSAGIEIPKDIDMIEDKVKLYN
jgi:Fe2+ transport system protein FeoA